MSQATTHFDGEFDADAWRGVLYGLTMLLLSWVAIPLVAFVFLPCVFITGPPGTIILISSGLVYLAFGVAHCCRVPADSGARAPLISTGVLLLNAVLFIAFYLMRLNPVGWRQTWLALVVGSVIGVSLVLAQLAWLLFLRAVAVALDDERLDRMARNYAIIFSTWAGVNVAAIWTSLAIGQSTAGIILKGWNVLLLIVHYFGIAAVSEAARQRIEETLQSHEQLNRVETATPE